MAELFLSYDWVDDSMRHNGIFHTVKDEFEKQNIEVLFGYFVIRMGMDEGKCSKITSQSLEAGYTPTPTLMLLCKLV